MGTLMKLFLFALLQVAIAQNYCSVCRDHTMCKYTGRGSKCSGTITSGVSSSEAQEIVNVHNAYRAKVAKGQEYRGRPGPQPSAANMQALVWDDKLAEVAQRWADQCTFQHDTCRNDPRFKVGQNIYWSSGFSLVNWTRAIDSWYNEVSQFNRYGVKNFRFDSSTGHYSQMVWANTRVIGCGRTSYGRAYKLKDNQPRELVLSALPTKINDTSSGESSSFKRTNRQANVGFFGGASFDPAGAQGAITGPSTGGSGGYQPAGTPDGNRPNYPGTGNRPNLPGTGNRPNLPSTGNRPNYPGTGNRPNYPSIGNRPNYPGTGNRPNYPGTGNRPNFPGSGYLPNWPGLGNLPFIGGLINPSNYGNTANFPNNPNYPIFLGMENRPNHPNYADNGPYYWSQSNFGENYGYYAGTSGYYPIKPNQYPINIPAAFPPSAPYYTGFGVTTGTPDNFGFYDGDKESTLFVEPIQSKPEEGHLPTYSEWQQAQLINAAQPSIGTEDSAQGSYNELSNNNGLGTDQILVCNYGPSGNYLNEPVYIEGATCSNCPTGTTCKNSLCVTY